jgi:hypothetical protein
VIIGAVTRPDVAHVRLDFGAIRNLPFLVSLGMGGDDRVLSSIVRFLEKKGYRVHGAHDVAPELLAEGGVLGKHAPSAEDRTDIALGFEVVRALGALDVGQAAVVAKGYVVAVEAAEGTDATIRRAGAMASDTVIVKASRNNQDPRFDIPAVGPETIGAMRDASARVLGIDAHRTLVLQRDRMIAEADAAGIAIVAADAPPLGTPVHVDA